MTEGRRTVTVLLVDDERDHLELMERALHTEADLKVISCQSSERALEIARSERVDIIVADQRMPGTQGAQLIDQCQLMHPEAPGVIVTAFPELPEVLAAVRARGYLVVAKPYDPEVLVRAIRHALMAKRSGANDLSGLNVLMVDDDAENLEFMQRALRSEPGLNLFTARDGPASIRIASTTPIDLVLADYRLPAMSGVSVIEQCRALHPDVVGVLVTGFADMPEVVSAKASGQYLVLFKPYAPGQLVATVKQASAFSRIRRALGSSRGR
jgi:DNA-binding NtrC family response regulator